MKLSKLALLSQIHHQVSRALAKINECFAHAYETLLRSCIAEFSITYQALDDMLIPLPSDFIEPSKHPQCLTNSIMPTSNTNKCQRQLMNK